MRTRYRVVAVILAVTLLIVVLWAFLSQEHKGLYPVTILRSLGGK